MLLSTMFIIIDNYDSFTYNLFHMIKAKYSETIVIRNDEYTVNQVFAKKPRGIIISPGPCTPYEAGISLELIKSSQSSNVPILGVCLGHQAIAQAYGAEVVLAPVPVHGKVSSITHKNKGIFAGIKSPLNVTRYHSLIVKKETLPSEFEITATNESGLIMGLSHKKLNLHGVQFHPESILSECGDQLIQNFINLACG